jgi:hypothetical protein
MRWRTKGDRLGLRGRGQVAREVRNVTLEDALRLCFSLTEVLMAGAALAELGRTPASEVAGDTLDQLVQRG